jgi:hypothetical protein
MSRTPSTRAISFAVTATAGVIGGAALSPFLLTDADPADSSPIRPALTAIEVDASGGQVRTPDGNVAVDVPRDAVVVPVTIEVRRGTPIESGEWATAGQAVQFGPSGTRFAHPLDVRLRYELPGMSSTAGLRVAHRDDESGAVELLTPFSCVDGELHVLVASFSTLQPIVVSPDDAGPNADAGEPNGASAPEDAVASNGNGPSTGSGSAGGGPAQRTGTQALAVAAASDVSDVRWTSDEVDVSATITFMSALVTLSNVGDSAVWKFDWSQLDSNFIQQGEARTPRPGESGYTLFQVNASQYVLRSFGLVQNDEISYTPGTARRLIIGPFISGTNAPRHPGIWEGRVIIRTQSGAVFDDPADHDKFLLIGHVAQKLPGTNPDGSQASGDGQFTYKFNTALAPFSVQVIRNDAQPGNMEFSNGVFSGVAKAGVQTSFSLSLPTADTVGASITPTSTVTNGSGLATTTLTTGDQPGVYQINGSVPNVCNLPNLAFTAEVRGVNYLRIRMDPTQILVRPGAGEDPVIFGISAPQVPSHQSITCIGFYNGLDRREETADDKSLGPVEADWVFANGAKNEATIVGAGPAGGTTTRTITLDGGAVAGTSKLKVSFTPENASRPTARGTFNVEIVEVVVTVLDEEGTIDGNPDAQDASGVNVDTLELELNGNAIAKERWIDLIEDFVDRRATFPTGKLVRFGPRFPELLRGANTLRVKVNDNAGNELEPNNTQLEYSFPQVPAGVVAATAAGGG